MTIIAYIGDKGSGKTLSMVINLYNNYHKKDKTIYSNMLFNFDNAYVLDKSFYENFKNSNYSLMSCAVVIDEAHVFVDSRKAMTPRNIMFSKFITQSRKRDVDLLYTTQDVSYERFMFSGQVELRLRKLTDVVIMCKTITYIDGKYPVINHEPLINPKKDKMYCLNFIYRGGQLIKKTVTYANPYFKKFDTHQIIDLDI